MTAKKLAAVVRRLREPIQPVDPSAATALRWSRLIFIDFRVNLIFLHTDTRKGEGSFVETIRARGPSDAPPHCPAHPTQRDTAKGRNQRPIEPCIVFRMS